MQAMRGSNPCPLETVTHRNAERDGSVHDCEFGRLVFSNHSAKADSATHGTKNIIANRLVAVSERSLIGRAAAIEVQFLFMTVGSALAREGSNPPVPTSESVRLVLTTGLRDYPRLFGCE